MKLVGAVVGLCLLGACVSSGEPVTGDRRNVGSVTQTFTATPATADVGRSIQLTMKLVNNGGQAVDIVTSSGQIYDMWATVDGEEVWRWSDGRAFTAAITTTTLPGQSGETFIEQWTPPTEGTYEVFGVVLAPDFDRPLRAQVEVG